jgi:N-acyl-D-amino-acid deacylase
LGDRFLDPINEAIEIGRRSGIPSHITHLYQRVTAPGGGRRILRVVEDAREEGLDVTFDSYTYTFSRTGFLSSCPSGASREAPGP